MVKQDDLYKEQFDLLSFSTNEYEQSVAFIRQAILPNLQSKKHFLDVGAGSGNLSKPLAPLFQQTTIVEPNSFYYGELMEWSSANGIQMAGYNGDWLDYSLDATVDLAVLAHVLYFVAPEKRSEFIRKAYDRVKPGGYMIIILISATSGIMHLYRGLLSVTDYRDMPSIEATVVDLHAHGYDSMHLDLFDAEIQLPSRQGLLQLIDFVVVEKVDFSQEPNRAKRDAYIDTYLSNDGAYSINSNIGVLSICKR